VEVPSWSRAGRPDGAGSSQSGTNLGKPRDRDRVRVNFACRRELPVCGDGGCRQHATSSLKRANETGAETLPMQAVGRGTGFVVSGGRGYCTGE